MHVNSTSTKLKLKESDLHLEVEVVDWDMREHRVGQHFPGVLHRRLLGAAEKLFLAHFGGDVLERLLLGVHPGTVALLQAR